MDNMRFSVVKNLPIPKGMDEAHQGRNAIYPFREMDLGDCIRFEAEGSSDSSYRKIYNSARSHMRRTGCPYEFRFARIDDRTFGCWKVDRDAEGSGKPERRRRRTALEIDSIPVETLKGALQDEGTVAGAARRVGISPRTFMRLVEKLGIR